MPKTRKTWLSLVAALAVVSLIVLFAAGDSKALEEGTPTANHYKCYPVLDWGVFDPVAVKLKDQFGDSQARVLQPYMLCNPVDKNGEGIADKKNHLVCYQIQDDPIGDYDRVKEVVVSNQFGETQLWVRGAGKELCLPSQKRLVQ